MTKKSNYGLAFVLGTSILLSFCFCPPFDLLSDDKEIWRYTGMAILKGLVPYRDIFDHKPPFIFFINAAGNLLGGPWGLWIINATLGVIVTAVLYRRCRQYRLYFPWLLPLLFNLMIRDNLVSEGINLTREYTTFFFVLFFCVVMSKSKYRDLLLGMFMGLIFFTQQEQVLQTLPFVLYILLTEHADAWYLRIGRMVLGGLLPMLPVVIYFAWNHSLSYFWDDGFRFNAVWYTAQPKSLWDHFRTIKKMLDAGNYEVPFMIALVLGGISVFLRDKRKGLLVAAVATLFLSLAPEFMGNRYTTDGLPADGYIDYFLPLSGSVCVLLFVIFAFADGSFLAGRNAQLPYVVLLCCSLGYTSLQHATHLIRRNAEPVISSPELTWLRRHPPGNYNLFVFNSNEYIYAYNELNILAPSRWIYHHMWIWYPKWDPDHALLRSIADDLNRHRTAYILMIPDRLQRFANPANTAYWLDFLQTYYEPMPIPGASGHLLWKRKDIMASVDR